jgi:hypothetical protein
LFETERCFINPFQKSDYFDVKKLYVNQEVRRFLGGIRQEDSIGVVMDEMLNSSDDSFYWVVRENLQRSLLGWFLLTLTTKAFTLKSRISFYRIGGDLAMQQKQFK